MTRFWLVLVVLGAALRASGQTYFNERYTNLGTQSAAKAVLALDSGYLVCGQGNDYPVPGSQALMLRFLDASGQQTRVRYFSRRGYAFYGPIYGGGFLALPDGGFVMGGTRQDTSGASVAMIWRFTAQGDTLWTRTYGAPVQKIGYSLCLAPNGGYALTGSVSRLSGTGEQAFLLCTDSLGNMVWEMLYGSRYGTRGYTVHPTPDHGFLVSGFTYLSGTAGGWNAPYVVKTDSTGQPQWERVLGRLTTIDGSCTARPTHDGNYIVAATISKGRIGSEWQCRPIFYKLNAQGQTLWRKEIGRAGSITGLYVVHEQADGSFVAAGQETEQRDASQGSGYAVGLLVKVCGNGDSLWYRTCVKLTGIHSENYLRDLQPAQDGGFVGTGFLRTSPPDTGSHDTWAFKIDSAGYLQSGGAPVTVQCRPLGIGLTAPAPEGGVEVWPNPSPDGRYALRLARAGRAEVVDAVGRVVWCGELAAGVGELDLRALPAGVYALRVSGLRPQLIIKNE